MCANYHVVPSRPSLARLAIGTQYDDRDRATVERLIGQADADDLEKIEELVATQRRALRETTPLAELHPRIVAFGFRDEVGVPADVGELIKSWLDRHKVKLLVASNAYFEADAEDEPRYSSSIFTAASVWIRFVSRDEPPPPTLSFYEPAFRSNIMQFMGNNYLDDGKAVLAQAFGRIARPDPDPEIQQILERVAPTGAS